MHILYQDSIFPIENVFSHSLNLYASIRAYFLDIPEYEALIYISSLRRIFYLIRPTLTTELRNRKMYTLVSYTNGFKKQKVNSESSKSIKNKP
jgi:hypothetical protein